MRARATIVIDRACDQVFDLVALRLFDTYHLWNTGVVDVREASEGPVRAGSRGVAVQYLKRGKRFREYGRTFEVTRLVDSRELELRGELSERTLGAYRTLVLFEALEARTRVSVDAQAEFALPFLMIGWPIVQIRFVLELRRNLARLRQALEAKTLPSRPRRVVSAGPG